MVPLTTTYYPRPMMNWFVRPAANGQTWLQLASAPSTTVNYYINLFTPLPRIPKSFSKGLGLLSRFVYLPLFPSSSFVLTRP